MTARSAAGTTAGPEPAASAGPPAGAGAAGAHGAVGAAGAVVATDAAVAPVRRMRWRLTAQPQLPGHPAPELRGARVAVLGGTPALAAAVAARLRGHGAQVVVDTGRGDRWTVGGRLPDGLVDLTLAEPFDPSHSTAHRPALLRTLSALRACYAQWEQETSARRLFYLAVTYMGGGMGFDDDDRTDSGSTDRGSGPQPLGGVWAGLAKTLHRELPNCNTRVLDTSLDDLGRLPDLVCRELYRWGLFEIGHRDGQRLSLQAVTAEAPAPTVRLGPDDLVLVSGGGRGIGWRIATALAREHGCRVVVTGRGPLPDPSVAPWLTAGEEEFKAYERTLWAGRTEGRPITEIRAAIETARRRRDLCGHLAAARRDGLDITYATCDFTDPDAVGGLLAGLGREPTAVIHNAGVDTPARFPKKSDEEFLRTVGTKTEGFLHLFRGVRHLPLKFFCAVGSLTGRLGGMVGQLDYGAANEGLARLALWADRVVPFPVMTLCWPTWDRVGMVANFEATLRYMTALDADEGVRLWLAELAGGSRGEITYVGPFGRALGPLQAFGYPGSEDLPGYRGLVPALFHLGEVRTCRPHRTMTTRVALTTDRAPVLTDFLVDGAEALPVSLLLENALWAAWWLPPEDLADVRPARIEHVRVQPEALCLDAGALLLERTAEARYTDGAWHVRVTYRTRAHSGPGFGTGSATAPFREAARMDVVHLPADRPPDTAAAPATAEPATAEPATTETDATTDPDTRADSDTRADADTGAAAVHSGTGPPPRLRWRGLVLPLADWHTAGDGTVGTRLTEAPAGDLWVLPRWPEHALPLTSLENLLRRTRAVPEQDAPGLRVARISMSRPFAAARLSGSRTVVTGDPLRGDWAVSDETSGAPVLRVHGVSLRGERQ